MNENMSEQTDADLVALARQGDKTAFGELIERYRPMARQLAQRMVWRGSVTAGGGPAAPPDVVPDLVQEAMLQAYLSLDHLRNDASFRAWLYGIVLNVCRNYSRRQKITVHSLEDMAGGLHFDALPLTSQMPDPQTALDAIERHRTVLEAVNLLSPKNRAATLLFYFDQLSLQEIADILGISITAVKSRLYKSRRTLRGHLAPVMDGVADLCAPPTGQPVSEMNRKENHRMIEVTIADIATVPEDNHNIIVLLDKMGQRMLLVWVGSFEAQAIVMGLRDISTARPMAYNFMASLLAATEATLEAVRVEALKGKTFFAVAQVRSGDRLSEVDARPSDALALAMVVGCPIYVSEDVMADVGKPLSQEEVNALSQGRNIGSIVDVIQANLQEHAQKMTAHADESVEEREAKEQRLRELFFS